MMQPFRPHGTVSERRPPGRPPSLSCAFPELSTPRCHCGGADKAGTIRGADMTSQTRTGAHGGISTTSAAGRHRPRRGRKATLGIEPRPLRAGYVVGHWKHQLLKGPTTDMPAAHDDSTDETSLTMRQADTRRDDPTTDANSTTAPPTIDRGRRVPTAADTATDVANDGAVTATGINLFDFSRQQLSASLATTIGRARTTGDGRQDTTIGLVGGETDAVNTQDSGSSRQRRIGRIGRRRQCRRRRGRLRSAVGFHRRLHRQSETT